MPRTARWPPGGNAAYRPPASPAELLTGGTGYREFDVPQRLREALDAPVVRGRPGPQGAECWSGRLEAMSASPATALPGGNPRLTTQLVDASRHGARVPRTFVTTDAGAATHHVAGSPVIATIPDSRPPDSRPLAPSPGLTPLPVGGRAEGADGTCPVVQEYVEHICMSPVHHTGVGITAARGSGHDFRLHATNPGSEAV